MMDTSTELQTARYTPVPDPRERLTLDPAEFGYPNMYHLMNAAIAPRPVAWVSTLGANGIPNLAPHSYTTVFSTDPPVIGFVSVGRKDSLNNAEATGEFALNIASLSLLEKLNLTAANFPPEEDELAWAGLSHVACDLIAPPRVGEAPVTFEARVAGIVPIGNCWLVLGEVLRVHVASDIWRDGRIDPTLLDPVLRLAGSQFAHLGPTINLPRPTYQDVLAGTVATREEGTTAP
jgi:flavin reductase (DIM6/NTAB) family NADH-FMN oxidoreductase RutF